MLPFSPLLLAGYVIISQPRDQCKQIHPVSFHELEPIIGLWPVNKYLNIPLFRPLSSCAASISKKWKWWNDNEFWKIKLQKWRNKNVYSRAKRNMAWKTRGFLAYVVVKCSIARVSPKFPMEGHSTFLWVIKSKLRNIRRAAFQTNWNKKEVTWYQCKQGKYSSNHSDIANQGKETDPKL